jgi:hypothetical protein
MFYKKLYLLQKEMRFIYNLQPYLTDKALYQNLDRVDIYICIAFSEITKPF